MTDSGEPENQRSKEEHLKKAFSEIERASSELDLPTEVVTFAESSYRQILKSREEQYWDIETTAMAVLYLAAKVQEQPIDPEEIVSIDRISTTRKSLLRRAKKVNNLLSLDIEAFVDTSPYINRYCNELDLTDNVKERAHEITEICSEAGISGGKNPSGWAAAAIYLASIEQNERVKQDQISEIANVSTVTIRNRYQEQRDAVRDAESIPSNPFDVIDWYADRIGVSDRIRERAHTILSCGDDEGYEINGSPAWPAAALRRASEEYDDEDDIGKKALKEPINTDSQDINKRVRELRQALSSSTEYRYQPADR